MRSAEEIIQETRRPNESDPFGFRNQVLTMYVPFDVAKAAGITTETAAEDKWRYAEPTREALLKDMAAYVEFAWDMVREHRRLSAIRSIVKMCAWLWLLEEEELFEFASDDDAPYAMYGAPILKRICEQLGFAVPVTPELHNMIEGLPCRPDCNEGCQPPESGTTN